MTRTNPYMIDKKELEELRNEIMQIKKICINNNIPYFMSFAVADDGVDTKYMNEIYSPAVSFGAELSDDKITPMINVVNGFKTVPPIQQDEFFYE